MYYSRNVLLLIISLSCNLKNVISENNRDEVVKRDIESSECERLKTSLTYKQENAPKDISAILRVVVEKLNRELSSVIDVEIDYSGEDIHKRVVGEHYVRAVVTREDLIENKKQCLEVPFTIVDTNECEVEEDNFMRHECRPPAKCQNTIGGYECVCPRLLNDSFDDENRSEWELSLESSSCPSHISTSNCCDENAHSYEGKNCRLNFGCPVDPCTLNKCDPKAVCSRASSPLSKPDYSCTCPDEYLGNGQVCQKWMEKPAPKIKENGEPTKETKLLLDKMCGCTFPIVDICAGYPTCKKNQMCTVINSNPRCVCAPGYNMHEEHGCVDETPPRLELNCDPNNTNTMILRQGDVYQECAVTVKDVNAEDYMRSLKISYSHPILRGCLIDVGEYYVTYTVATPWTSNPNVSIRRKVVVEDLNACNLTPQKKQDLVKRGCQSLIPSCVEEATCLNTLGSYKCICPDFTQGDGLHKGTGCSDNHPPTLELLGPQLKVFQTVPSTGLIGVLNYDTSFSLEDVASRKNFYQKDILQKIQISKGLELCASSSNTKPQHCVRAIDQTPFGDVDLTSRVTIGELQLLNRPPGKNMDPEAFYWRVPYEVQDDAGNQATTVYRYIQVKELSLKEIHLQFNKQKEEAVKNALATVASDKKCPPCGTSSSYETIKQCPPCPSDSITPLQQCKETPYDFFGQLSNFSSVITYLCFVFFACFILGICAIIFNYIFSYFGNQSQHSFNRYENSVNYYSNSPSSQKQFATPASVSSRGAGVSSVSSSTEVMFSGRKIATPADISQGFLSVSTAKKSIATPADISQGFLSVSTAKKSVSGGSPPPRQSIASVTSSPYQNSPFSPSS